MANKHQKVPTIVPKVVQKITRKRPKAPRQSPFEQIGGFVKNPRRTWGTE